ncbi:uncharacterized protein LOC144703402, partial [Wolffia australiana]
ELESERERENGRAREKENKNLFHSSLRLSSIQGSLLYLYEMEVRSQGPGKPPIWDCGSKLYDSLERRTFEQQLDSTIASRSYSMPHHQFVPLTMPKKLSNKSETEGQKRSIAPKSIISKLLRSVFWMKPARNEGQRNSDQEADGRLPPVHGGLHSIPEWRGRDSGPSAPGTSVSERFKITSTRISCS